MKHFSYLCPQNQYIYVQMKRNFLLWMGVVLMMVIGMSSQAMAQTDYYYYYMGKKIPLTLNDNKVIVSVSKDCIETIERIRTNVQVLSTIKDKTLDIIIISRSDFEKLTSQDFWEEDAKSVILTSSYFTEENKEVFETPYLDVALKKEEDIDLLNSYIEKYKLRIAEHHPSLMPEWYILAITPESEIGSLKCANELYESGDFAEAIADLAEGGSIDGITTVKTDASSAFFDLNGRKIQQPQKGLYIQNGKKILK